MAGITHSVVATGTNTDAKQVSVTAWNANHVIDQLPITAVSSEPSADSTKLIMYFYESGTTLNKTRSLRVKFPGNETPIDLITEIA